MKSTKACIECGRLFLRRRPSFRCKPCAKQRAIFLTRRAVHCHRAVAQAIARGDLVSLCRNVVPCVDCGERARVYDHRDYSRPLAVDPVCRGCNQKRGHSVQAVAA